MNIGFITKEIISYNEAPPSRILNLKRVLEQYHNVYIFSKGSEIDEKNVFTVPFKGSGFISSQLFKIIMLMHVSLLLLLRRLDYLIIREYYFIIALYPLAKLFRCTIIYDMHCFRYKELQVEGRNVKAAFIKFFELLSHRFANRISVISQGIMEDLPISIKKKSFLLPNGVSLDDFKGIKPDSYVLKKYHIPSHKKIVGFIGNWMEWVDIPTLLESSKYYDKDTVLLVVGKCYQGTSIKKLSKAYPNVIFTDRIEHKDSIQLLQRIDVCVLPYKKAEVLKHLSIRKTMEYLASAKPIIMSNSNIGERRVLEENKNMILYKAGDAKDLAGKVTKLLNNKSLMKKLSTNNKKLSESLDWKEVILGSDLFEVIKTFDALKDKNYPKGSISIIIKALNEEEHIAECIESALAALKGYKGEVILADSKSTDRTVEIAKKYPITILQLKHAKDRCCGIGPQMGFVKSKGEYLYILDGDMAIDKDFFSKALPYFADLTIAGVGGNIVEKSKDNLAFQVRSKSHVVEKTKKVQQLGMGGLYRREALENIGYFSNAHFYAYEEYDLGAELISKGCNLIRIPYTMVSHYGDETTSIMTLVNRMRSKYLFGSGQYLRRAFTRRHFFKTLGELKIYVFTLIWIFLGIFSVASIAETWYFVRLYVYCSFFLLALLFIIKRNTQKLIFSIFSWSFQAVGMFLGLFLHQKDPKNYIPDMKKIQ